MGHTALMLLMGSYHADLTLMWIRVEREGSLPGLWLEQFLPLTHTHIVNGLFTRVPKNGNNYDNGLLFITNQCTNAYPNVCVKEAVQWLSRVAAWISLNNLNKAWLIYRTRNTPRPLSKICKTKKLVTVLMYFRMGLLIVYNWLITNAI